MPFVYLPVSDVLKHPASTFACSSSTLLADGLFLLGLLGWLPGLPLEAPDCEVRCALRLANTSSMWGVNWLM